MLKTTDYKTARSLESKGWLVLKQDSATWLVFAATDKAQYESMKSQFDTTTIKEEKKRARAERRKNGSKLEKLKGLLVAGSNTKEQLVKLSGISAVAFYSALHYLKKKGLTIVHNGNEYNAK